MDNRENPLPIICRYSRMAGQWQAWFEGPLGVPGTGALPMDAVRALLEKSNTPAGTTVTVRVDQDVAGIEVQTRRATWQPPALRERIDGGE